jgi:hypothetical protein
MSIDSLFSKSEAMGKFTMTARAKQLQPRGNQILYLDPTS